MAKRAVSRGRRSKYGAIKTTVDGITFASKREAKRYVELKLLEKRGFIRGLMLQPRYGIHVEDSRIDAVVRGKDTHVCDYVADFVYHEKQIDEGGFSGRWRTVIEDVKGFKTPVYRLKKKLVEAQYGITITEV